MSSVSEVSEGGDGGAGGAGGASGWRKWPACGLHAYACTCMHMHAHAQVGKLNHIISEADAGRLRQKRDYDLVINERDILGTQVRLLICTYGSVVYT